MPAPEAASPNGSDVFGTRELRPLFLVLSVIVVATLLLSTLQVFDWSVFAFGLSPRAELIGATLAAVGYLTLVAAKLCPHPWLFAVSLGLLAPLSAAAFLAWEATTLVLCPGTIALTQSWEAFAPHPSVFGLDASLALVELSTGCVAFAAAASFLWAMATTKTALQRRRVVRAALLTLVTATTLTLLVPVAGPAHGLLPLPSAPEVTGSANAAAVPRIGFVCVPAVVVCTMLWSVWRERTQRIARNALLGLALFVVSLELLGGRYSWLSVGVAVFVVACAPLTLRTVNSVAASSSIDATLTATPDRSSEVPDRDKRATSRVRLLLTIVFFFSGMAALVYQVVFAKGLALTFGSTSHASTIVLATYMGGLALGSWLGGRLAANLRKPVIAYALAELGIAAICAVAPFTLRAARWFYVTIAEGANPSEPWLIALQLSMGALILVPPTWLMGLTLPLLTRQFLDAKNNLGSSAGLLYTSNTLGAAVGASITGYFVLPAMGIESSLMLAVFTNILVALFAVLAASTGQHTASTKASTTPAPVDREPQDENDVAHQTDRDAVAEASVHAQNVAWIAVIQLTIGGFVTFGLETTFIHLLATVAGTSTYAFSLMLFAFLIGLSLGSSLGRRWLPDKPRLPQALLVCQLSLAAMLLFASQFWDYLPAYFASFGRWPYTLTFASREFVRFVVCLAVMLPAAICIGAQFPIAMQAVGFGWPRARLQALGRASAMNTVGNILGALVIGFVALPRLGSHRTLGLLTFLCLCLSALALWVVERKRRPLWFGLVAATLTLLFVQPPQFDLTRLSAGGNVYFKPQYYGRVIDHAESLDGGLTAVALSHESSTIPVKTLLTNGKFQGNNRRDSSGEMMAQTSFAVAPLLHTAQRARALVIGFGTGTTTRVLDEAGFGHVTVAELSGDIVALADRHFEAINQGVIHRPNVHVHITDGRNFLLLDRHRYDLIGIELSSIWFAGAANLYNDEFYALVEPRLTDRGVLQQWIQLHRLNHRDVMSILVTLRQRFPRIWLYFLGKQGILVACKHDCLPSTEAINRLRDADRLKTTLSVFDRGLGSILGGRMLTPEGIDQLILDYRNSAKVSLKSLVSTDDNLYLEYSTPKGNVREYDESIADNEAFLARFRAPNPFEATRLELNALR